MPTTKCFIIAVFLLCGSPFSGFETRAGDTPITEFHPPVEGTRCQGSGIHCVAFSPDGNLLAAAGGRLECGNIFLWDIEKNELLYHLKEHSRAVYQIAFSSDGKTLLSGGRDGAIRFWDVSTGKMKRSLQLDESILTFSLSPDEKTIAFDCNNQSTLEDVNPEKRTYGRVRLIDVESGDEIATLDSDHLYTHAVAFSPDGKVMASGGGDDFIRIWDVGSRKVISILSRHRAAPGSLKFSADGKLLAAGDTGLGVVIWNVKEAKQIYAIPRNTVWPNPVDFSRDEKFIAIGDGGAIKFISLDNGKQVNKIISDRYAIFALDFSPDGRTIASGSYNGTVRIWRIPDEVLSDDTQMPAE